MPTSRRIILAVAVVMGLSHSAALGDPLGTAFTYQGRLTDGGSPPADADYDINFTLWNALSGGTQIDADNPAVRTVHVVNGLFTTPIDFDDPAAWNGERRWLEIAVCDPLADDCSSPPTNFTTLDPRQEVTAAPYALYALSGSGSGLWTQTGSDIYYDSGNVGIGTSSPPQDQLDVYGPLRLSSEAGDGDWRMAATSIGDFLLQDSSSGENVVFIKNGAPANALRIDGAGRVGIGTTNPTHRLHVSGPDRYEAMKIETTNGGPDDSAIIWMVTGERNWGLINDAAMDVFKIRDHTAQADRFSIDTNGNVGIGTTNPTANLEINSGTDGDSVLKLVSDTDNDNEDDNPYLVFGQDGLADLGFLGLTGTSGTAFDGQAITGSLANALILYRRESQPLQLGSNGAIAMTIEDGNVGIGTTDPQAKLHIHDGDILLSDSAGTQTVQIRCTEGTGANGSTILLRDPSGNTTAELDANTGRGSQLDMYKRDIVGSPPDPPVRTVLIQACDGADQGAGVTLHKADGTASIRLNAEQGVGGPSKITTEELEAVTSTFGPAVRGETSAELTIEGAESTAIEGYNTSSFSCFGRLGYAVVSGDLPRPYGGYFDGSSGGTGIYARGGSAAGVFQGNVRIKSYATGTTVVELGEGLDYAEGFDVSEDQVIRPGAVLVIDPSNPGKLALSTTAYDRKVAGIVAGAKDLGSGVRLGGKQFDRNVALAGRVYCNVDATHAAVEPGDLLTTAATPGYAMKVADYTRAQGAILGKAMEKLEQGTQGQILVLVTLQ